jgi:hypothetical protein
MGTHSRTFMIGLARRGSTAAAAGAIPGGGTGTTSTFRHPETSRRFADHDRTCHPCGPDAQRAATTSNTLAAQADAHAAPSTRVPALREANFADRSRSAQSRTTTTPRSRRPPKRAGPPVISVRYAFRGSSTPRSRSLYAAVRARTGTGDDGAYAGGAMPSSPIAAVPLGRRGQATAWSILVDSGGSWSICRVRRSA